ncbi:hypothetical protein [Neorhizobium alkalisoli]|nr:hypothetical protein [Neorhizobium alkalisoli]
MAQYAEFIDFQENDMNFSTDDRGRLALGGIHDSTITQFSLDAAAKRIGIQCLSDAGIITDFAATSLYTLNISALWEGSVISDIFVWDFTDVPDDYLFDPEIGWRHLFEGRIDDRNQLLAQIERYKERLPKAKLVSIGCSYGGNISFLCQELRIEQTHPVSSSQAS